MSAVIESPQAQTRKPSSLQYHPSSPKRKRLPSSSSSEVELKFTEIRGRKYLLSPQSSPSSSRHKPRHQLSNSGLTKRSLSFSVPEQHETSEEIELDADKKGVNLTKKMAHPARCKRKRKDSEADLIGSYGSEKESERQAQSHQKRIKRKPAPKKKTEQEKSKATNFSKEVVFSSKVAKKWQPISSEVLSIFNSILVAALGQSTGALRGVDKYQAEKQLQRVIREVSLELKSARAPKHKPRLTQRTKQAVSDLKEECAALVERNNQLEEALKEKARVTEELTSRAELLGVTNPGSGTGHYSNVLQETSNFEDYVKQLFNS